MMIGGILWQKEKLRKRDHTKLSLKQVKNLRGVAVDEVTDNRFAMGHTKALALPRCFSHLNQMERRIYVVVSRRRMNLIVMGHTVNFKGLKSLFLLGFPLSSAIIDSDD